MIATHRSNRYIKRSYRLAKMMLVKIKMIEGHHKSADGMSRVFRSKSIFEKSQDISKRCKTKPMILTESLTIFSL